MMTNVISTAQVSDRTRGSGAAGADTAANVLIIDRDRDCADALQLLLSGLSGVGMVRIARTASDAIGRSLARTTLSPDIILVDAYHRYASEQSLLDVLRALRQRFPKSSIVLLCVYPECPGATSQPLADRCLPKDTSARELQSLINDHHARRSAVTAG